MARMLILIILVIGLADHVSAADDPEKFAAYQQRLQERRSRALEIRRRPRPALNATGYRLT